MVTITDDDALPSLSIDDVTVPAEGNTGTVNAIFTVTPERRAGAAVTVDYATVADSAVSPADYTHDCGPAHVHGGADDETVTVPVKGDTIDESNERFFLDLDAAGRPGGGNRGRPRAGHDHGRRRHAAGLDRECDRVRGRRNAEPERDASTPPSGLPVTVDYSTTEPDGTATDADYAPTTGTITFAPGDMSEPCR